MHSQDYMIKSRRIIICAKIVNNLDFFQLLKWYLTMLPRLPDIAYCDILLVSLIFSLNFINVLYDTCMIYH